jgi:hypothetical protein
MNMIINEPQNNIKEWSHILNNLQNQILNMYHILCIYIKQEPCTYKSQSTN